MSFTASAGHDVQAGISAAQFTAAALPLADLIPASRANLAASPGLPRLDLHSLIRDPRPSLEAPDQTDELLATAPPRSDLKTTVGGYPTVDRARKADPLIALSPTLSPRAKELLHATGQTPSSLLFGRTEDERLAMPLLSGAAEAPDVAAEPAFAPWQGLDPTTTRLTRSVQSPATAAAGSTGAGIGAATPRADGSTPAVPRAVALASTTPAPADATPIEVAAAPVSLPGLGVSPRLDRGARGSVAVARIEPGEKPNYAELVNPDNAAREQRCLAEAVYFEARSEPEAGQAAVAQVVLNRAKSGLYPSSVCGVVYQNRHRHLACQFTFACEGKSLRVTDSESWRSATRIAKEVFEGKTYLADVGGATHYHANYVRPRWARKLKKMDVIGRHIFYKLRPGQT